MRVAAICFLALRGSLAGGILERLEICAEDVSEELALLHHFSFKKQQGVGEVRFVITVKEFAAPPQGQFARFFAQADKHVNQKLAPILPTGWGNSLLDALTACARMIREFPYEGEEPVAAKGAPGS